jgi:predicted transcriptional regulator
LSVDKEVNNIHESLNYYEAILFTDSKKWMGAMHEEMESLEKNDTWNVVRLPSKKKAVTCKWIFKRKEVMTPNELARYKARLVTKDISQIPGIDYTDVYSLVVKHSSIRTFLSLVSMSKGYVVLEKEDYVCVGVL